MDMVLVKTPNGALAPADEEARALIEKLKAGQGVRATVRKALAPSHFCGYTSPVTSKKGVIGIGVPMHRCDESRSFSSAEYAASLSVPPVMAARMGERKLRRFAQAVPGTPTRSSCRPQLALGAAVFANRTAWRPIMSQSTRAPAQTPLQHARAVLGQSPRDVATYLSISTESLDWLSSVFKAIEILHEKGGGEVHIKRLVGLGKYVADDIGNLIGCAHEEVVSAIEAAEAKEGGAA